MQGAQEPSAVVDAVPVYEHAVFQERLELTDVFGEGPLEELLDPPQRKKTAGAKPARKPSRAA